MPSAEPPFYTLRVEPAAATTTTTTATDAGAGASTGTPRVIILDQTRLPHQRVEVVLPDVAAVAQAIVTMQVRGAPLIGVTAAHGVALAMQVDASDTALTSALQRLAHTRPTAVNLHWALEQMRAHLAPLVPAARTPAAWALAAQLAADDRVLTEAIARHGLTIFQQALAQKQAKAPHAPVTTLHVLTHCNAGRLGTLGLGTATAPMYLAADAGLPLHVWVSETRPRLQGALTAWELGQADVALTVVTDNNAGHLMQHGLVDLVIVGADRVTARGDVANKIGTYLKALAAKAHGIPFYVAFAGNTIDWTLWDGVAEIPIEERSAREVTEVGGVPVMPPGVVVRNDAFDVTPASLITGLITERGVCAANPVALRELFGRA